MIGAGNIWGCSYIARAVLGEFATVWAPDLGPLDLVFLLHGVLEGTGLVTNSLESVLAVTGVLVILLQDVLEVGRFLTAGRALIAEGLGDGVDSVEFGCHFQDGVFGMWCRSVICGSVVCICMYAKL
jgi:hypothetical protein